jgi:tripeptide aminopeptidase
LRKPGAATFRGLAAHAGVRPERGRSAVLAAAKAILAMPQGRLDEGTTTNVASIRGGTESSTNIVPDLCRVTGECRSLDAARAEETLARIVDALHDAANDPANPVDVDVTTERRVRGFRLRPNEPAVAAAEEALRACGRTPAHIATGGASDANTTAGLGVPTLDGLGPVGGNDHSPAEYLELDSIVPRVTLFAALLLATARDETARSWRAGGAGA